MRAPGCSMSLSEAFESLENAKIFYADWINEVRRSVPKDQLLELNLKGYSSTNSWSKLCTFLGIEQIPDEPFPVSNEGEVFKARMVNIRQGIWIKIFKWMFYALAFIMIVLAMK